MNAVRIDHADAQDRQAGPDQRDPAVAHRQPGHDQRAAQRARRERGAVQPGHRPAEALLVAQQGERRAEPVEEPAVAAELRVGQPGAPVPLQPGHAESVPSAPTTWSMQAVSASTSAGSTAGNIAIRSWLRPSLR